MPRPPKSRDPRDLALHELKHKGRVVSSRKAIERSRELIRGTRSILDKAGRENRKKISD